MTRTQGGSRVAPDAALAGSPVARRLIREATAGSGGLRRVDVIGPGGHGKTVLLDALAVAFREAGIPVHRELPPAGEPLAAGVALLVDDAHLLPPADLARLTELAGRPDGHLVVAHRQWPRPPGTAALGGVLAAARPPVLLEALDRTGVAARAALLLGERAGAGDRRPAGLVDLVHAQTAGLPALVDRLLTALGEQAGPDRARVPLPDEPPPGLLVQLGYTVLAQGPGTRELLLARALGAPLEAEVLVPLLGDRKSVV